MTKMSYKYYVLLSWCFVMNFDGSYGSSMPLSYLANYVETCPISDTSSLDTCLFSVIEKLRGYLPQGIPEWSVPSMEPLEIDQLIITQGGGAATVRAVFSKIHVYGLSNFTTFLVRSDPLRYSFRAGLRFPELRISGQYVINGQVLILPITGKGPFHATFRDVSAVADNMMRVADDQTLNLYDSNTDFQIGKLRLKLEHLFNGDKFLGDTVNTFLNENSGDLIKEFRPAFAKEVDKIIVRAFTGALAHLPIDSWNAAIH